VGTAGGTAGGSVELSVTVLKYAKTNRCRLIMHRRYRPPTLVYRCGCGCPQTMPIMLQQEQFVTTLHEQVSNCRWEARKNASAQNTTTTPVGRIILYTSPYHAYNEPICVHNKSDYRRSLYCIGRCIISRRTHPIHLGHKASSVGPSRFGAQCQPS